MGDRTPGAWTYPCQPGIRAINHAPVSVTWFVIVQIVPSLARLDQGEPISVRKVTMMTKHEGEWPYHEDKHGNMVPCQSNPCRRHSGGDIMAANPEEAYRKANETMTSGMTSGITSGAGEDAAEKERKAAIRMDMLMVVRTDMHARGMEAGPRTAAGILEHAIFDRTEDCDDAMAIVRRFRSDMRGTPSYRLHPGTGQENEFIARAVKECAKEGEGGRLAKDLSVVMETGMTRMKPAKALELVRSYDNNRLRTMYALNINNMVDDGVAQAMIDNADRTPSDVPGDEWEKMMGDAIGKDQTGTDVQYAMTSISEKSMSMVGYPKYHKEYSVGDMCVQLGAIMDIAGKTGEGDHAIKDGDAFRETMIGSRDKPAGRVAQTVMSI